MKINDPSFQNKKRTSIGYLIGTISVIINILLFLIKYWIGLQLGSIAILAEAWHTLSDSLTSLVVLIGFKVASQPPDQKHPFGHGRAEVISSVIIGTTLAIVAFNFFSESVKQLLIRESVNFNQTALIIFITSLIAKEFLAQISIRTGKKINAHSLITDGWHHRSDAFASALIIIGILVSHLAWWTDGILGLIVSMLILYVSYDIIKDTISSLIGEEPSLEFKSRLQMIVKQNVPFDVQLHHLHRHKYGNHQELTFHILLPEKMQLKEAHQIATHLEKIINQEMAVETTIHIETR
jgi:cation diffusion facilitator family transporter